NERGNPHFQVIRTQRWRCISCGRYFTSGDGTLRSGRLADIAARDAVASACFEQGYSAAASLFGIDRKTARSLWEEWAEVRECDLPTEAPEFIGLHRIRTA